MWEFRGYYGRHKRTNSVLPQQDVATKDNILRLRIDSKLKKCISELSVEKNKSASELTRLLWQDYFKKLDNKLWQEEIKEW